ncbi:MAG: UpxY family transcription antiterminator [Bacteroidetes bacterium]|nr:UpxY family transcription antiterminator [Bacteroidota bacterium]
MKVDESASIKKWHVIYTKSKWEKKVDGLLLKNGIESWCPVQKKERQWSDRKKIIEEPLFRSYVFVKINKSEHSKVLGIIGVVNFLYFEKKPAIIRDNEIEVIRKYLGLANTAIQVVNLTNLPAQTKVSINQGLFMGQKGEVIRSSKKTVFVQLQSINMMMIVEFKVEEVSLH